MFNRKVRRLIFQEYKKDAKKAISNGRLRINGFLGFCFLEFVKTSGASFDAFPKTRRPKRNAGGVRPRSGPIRNRHG